MTSEHACPTTVRRPRFEKALKFVFRNRIRISFVVFFALIAEDIFEGVEPLDLTNVTQLSVCLGLSLVAAGTLLRSWAAGILHKRIQLTTSGPYGLVRHPLYVGSFMMMLGFSALVNDTENIWIVIGPILAILVLRSIDEERSLSARFPADWKEYTESVPRYVPRRLSTNGPSNWSLRQWLHNREYQAASAALVGLVAIQCWHLM
jgi:protein-S-isoprenylcysteine O-methyltransferase Ste14